MKSVLTVIFSVLVLTSMNSCVSTGGFVDIQSLTESLSKYGPVTPEAYPDDDAVVLFQSTHVAVSLNRGSSYITPKTEVTTHNVIKVFRNISEYSTRTIRLGEKTRLQEATGRIIQPDGTITLLSEKDIVRTEYTSKSESDTEDGTVITYNFPGVKENSTLEFQYKYADDNFFSTAYWSIQGYTPVLKNVYKLEAPILMVLPKENDGFGWTWRYKAYNYELPDPVVTKPVNASGATADAKVVYTWTLENIPAFRSEPRMPPHNQYRAYLQFADFDWATWNDVAKEYLNYFYKDKTKVTDRVKKLTDSLVAGATTEEQKIQALYNYTQNLRYLTIPLGERGYRPQLPDLVIENQYGDCKDKSTLLITMLKALNYDAKPVLALTTDAGKTDPFFPARRFNHMFVKLVTPSGKVYWLDPTMRYARLGDFRDDCEGINVLVLDTEKLTGVLEKTPLSSSKENLMKVTQDIIVENNDTLLFNITMAFQGEYNHSNRKRFKEYNQEDFRKYFKSIIAEDFVNARLVSWSISDIDSIFNDFTLKFSFKTASGISRQSDLVFIAADPIGLLGGTSWLSLDKRKYPVVFDHAYRLEKTSRLKFPSDRYSIRNLPDAMRLTSNTLYYRKDYKQPEQSVLEFTEEFEMKDNRILVSEYPEAKKFFESVKGKMQERLIFTYR